MFGVHVQVGKGMGGAVRWRGKERGKVGWCAHVQTDHTSVHAIGRIVLAGLVEVEKWVQTR